MSWSIHRSDPELTVCSDDAEGQRVKLACAFSDDRWTAGRSITDVDWSPKVSCRAHIVSKLTPAQFHELAVASYNKNPAALNDPDGIVAVWNLHLLERPEFVFHAPVRIPVVTMVDLSVRRALGHLLPVSPHTHLWRVILWSSAAVGHSREAFASLENAFIGRWSHVPNLLDEDCWHAKRQQPDIEQHRWSGLQLGRRYARSASGGSNTLKRSLSH